jgi:archaellum component FlaC
MRPLLSLVAVALAALVLAACGGDTQEEATEKVCDAAADMEQRVDGLASLAIVTASPDQIEEDLNAIGDDLETIKDSAGDLREDERNEVDEAAQSLESTVDEFLSEIGQSESLADAAQGIESAGARLGTSIQALIAPIDCPE